MAELTLKISDELDAQIRSHVLKHGGDLSAYVHEAIRQRLFWDTVDAVRRTNAGTDSADVERDAAQALSETRADRR